jgi:hypothetical protein
VAAELQERLNGRLARERKNIDGWLAGLRREFVGA